MTKAQRTLLEIQGRQSEMRSRLAVLAAQDTRSADEETELTTVETKLSGCEPELRSALAAAAAEDDSSRTVETTDPETRERLELRGKTGIGDFLAAAAVGAVRSQVRQRSMRRRAACRSAVTCRWRFFRPLRPQSRTRAITARAGRAGGATADRPVRLRAKSAAAIPSGYMMPIRPVRPSANTRGSTTAPPADTLAKDGAAPATAAAVSLVNQAPVRIAGSFEVRTEDLAVIADVGSGAL